MKEMVYDNFIICPDNNHSLPFISLHIVYANSKVNILGKLLVFHGSERSRTSPSSAYVLVMNTSPIFICKTFFSDTRRAGRGGGGHPACAQQEGQDSIGGRAKRGRIVSFIIIV
jgi:hypothetical protein